MRTLKLSNQAYVVVVPRTKRYDVGTIEGATRWCSILGFELRALGDPLHDGLHCPGMDVRIQP